MQRIKPSIVLAAVAVVGMAVYASAFVDQTGNRMAVAASAFGLAAQGEVGESRLPV